MNTATATKTPTDTPHHTITNNENANNANHITCTGKQQNDEDDKKHANQTTHDDGYDGSGKNY